MTVQASRPAAALELHAAGQRAINHQVGAHGEALEELPQRLGESYPSAEFNMSECPLLEVEQTFSASIKTGRF